MANPFIKSIIQRATLNQDLFGETITYNGKDITAVVEVGQNEAQTSGFMKLVSGASVINGNGFFTVSIDDVPHPKRGDRISYNGDIYYVAGIELVDTAGGTVTVKVSANERGYRNA